MPAFFFHHHAPQRIMQDDIGCDFATFELAYLDAYRSMIEIGAELLREQQDPSRHRIEISDREGRVLIDLHFNEVFRPRRALNRPDSRLAALRENMQHAERLKTELKEVCVSARASVSKAHEMLRRARSIA